MTATHLEELLEGQEASYELLGRMQAGGMAEVFRARRVPDGRRVAVKRMLSNLADQSHFMDMFTDEARIAMKLDHPNIVETLDVGTHDDLPFIVMERVEGVDLRDLFDKCANNGVRIPVGLVCSLIASIGDALSYGHNTPDGKGRPLRVVHRDVSPANILVSSEGQVKLIDFGVAKARDRVARTSTGLLKGKISYLSPEQLSGTPADHRADIFAAGAVLWELLTCERLFNAATDYQTFELVRKCKPPPASSLNPLVPRALDKIVSKALARDPDERYQDAAELRDALASFLRSLGERWTPDRIAEWVRAAIGIDILEPPPEPTPEPSMPKPPAVVVPEPAAPPPSARPPAAHAMSARPAGKKARDANGDPIALSTWDDSTGIVVPAPSAFVAKQSAAKADAPPKPEAKADRSLSTRPKPKKPKAKAPTKSRPRADARPRHVAPGTTERLAGAHEPRRLSGLLLLLMLSLVTSAFAAPELWLPIVVS